MKTNYSTYKDGPLESTYVITIPGARDIVIIRDLYRNRCINGVLYPYTLFHLYRVTAVIVHRQYSDGIELYEQMNAKEWRNFREWLNKRSPEELKKWLEDLIQNDDPFSCEDDGDEKEDL